jgi:hypothetical protein
MGMSSYYLGLPREVLDGFRSEPGCFEMMQTLWHAGAGAWTAAAEFERVELLEMVSHLSSVMDTESVLETYARLIEKADAANPAISRQRVYIEKTHAYHEVMIRRWLRSQNVSEAEDLACSAVNGGDGGEAVEDLWCLSEHRVALLGRGFQNANADDLLAKLPTMAEELPELLDWMSPEERLEHLRELASDVELNAEVEGLVALYRDAAATRHVVLVG